jgi:hypothetical protein
MRTEYPEHKTERQRRSEEKMGSATRRYQDSNEVEIFGIHVEAIS